MEYKKIKVQKWKDYPARTGAERLLKFDYLEWVGENAIYRAPDTPAGKAILDNRRKREQ